MEEYSEVKIYKSKPEIKSYVNADYSQRSYLARIKDRVDKGVMPFSRSCWAVQITMADSQIPAMQSNKLKLSYKTKHKKVKHRRR